MIALSAFQANPAAWGEKGAVPREIVGSVRIVTYGAHEVSLRLP